MLTLDNRPNEEWAYLSSSARQNTKIAFFIHGFTGNYLGTWGLLPPLLEANAEGEAPFDEWDYAFVGYETTRVKSYLDIAGLLRTNIDRALGGDTGYRRRYTKLALFGHSLGTLGIRQLLCACELHSTAFIGAIHAITFFGTPLNGSPLARIPFIEIRYPIAMGLKQNCAQLRMLASWTKSAHPHRSWPSVRIVVGLDDRVVGHIGEFVDWAGDQRPYVVTNFDHRDIKKPTAWTSSTVIDEIRRAL